MRCNFETIALLYHATGTGKTVTAVMDAKRFGKRTLFLAHTVELVDQAAKTFRELWPRATVGRYVESMKQGNASWSAAAFRAWPEPGAVQAG